jgi:hypothetical protein
MSWCRIPARCRRRSECWQRRQLDIEGDGEGTDSSVLHLRRHGQDVGEHHSHPPGQNIGDRRDAAAIRYLHHVDAGHHLEHLGGDVIGRAGAD